MVPPRTICSRTLPATTDSTQTHHHSTSNRPQLIGLLRTIPDFTSQPQSIRPLFDRCQIQILLLGERYVCVCVCVCACEQLAQDRYARASDMAGSQNRHLMVASPTPPRHTIGTEFTGVENLGWIYRHQTAGLENEGVD